MTSIIISTIFCLIALFMLLVSFRNLGKADGIISSVAIIMSRIKVETHQTEEHSSSLPEGKEENVPQRTVVKGFMEYPTEVKKQSLREFNMKGAKYAGVLHTFKRGGKHKERPVMTYKWKNEDIYFEYSEDGSPVRLSGDSRKQILSVLSGEKCRNFKVYELK